MPLINCETEVDVSWSKNRIISEILGAAQATEGPPALAKPETSATGATFKKVTPIFLFW